MNSISNRSLVVIAFLVGLCYLVLVPPLQVPDEQGHFYRAYQVSEGQLFAYKIGRMAAFPGEHTGGELPVSLGQLNAQFRKIVFKPEAKLTRENYTNAWNVRTDNTQRQLYTFSNTSLFSFVSYLVPASGLRLSAFFSDRTIVQFYSARIANLIFAVFCLWLACKLFKPARLLFLFITLLPMNIHQLVAVSSDAFTNSIALVFIASVLRIFTRMPSSARQQIIAVMFGALLACAKQIATPLLGIMVLARRCNFPSQVSRLIFIFGFYSLTILTILFWVFKAQHIYNPLYWHADSDANQQLQYFIQNFTSVTHMFAEVLYQKGSFYFQTAIGERLGFQDVLVPQWVINLYITLIMFIILLHPRFSGITRFQAVGFIGICVVALFVVQLALYMHTMPVGADNNFHVHGRYYIVYIALALIALLQLMPHSQALKDKVAPVFNYVLLTGMFVATFMVLRQVVIRYFII